MNNKQAERLSVLPSEGDILRHEAVIAAFREFLPIYKDYQPSIVTKKCLEYAEDLVEAYKSMKSKSI